MKIVASVVIVVLAGLAASAVPGEVRGAAADDRTQTLEQKLELLATCGLALSDPFGPEDLLASWDREDYEQPGCDRVLVGPSRISGSSSTTISVGRIASSGASRKRNWRG